MITASKLELFQRCPGHLTLPHRDEPNEWSEAGNERHAEDEQAILAGDIPERYTEQWAGLAWRTEVAYAWDASDGTSRFLGTGIGRNYGTLRPFEIAGTIDVEGRGPGILVVIDKKGYEAVTPAAQNPQVRFLAMAAARYQPAERVEVAISPELGGLDVAVIDGFELDVIAHDTRQLLIRAVEVRKSKSAELNTGRWCRWCPAFAACPRQGELTALARRAEDDPELALRLVIDHDSARDVYDLWQRIGILHKRIGQQIHAWAAVHTIPLDGRRRFGKYDAQGPEKLNADTVYQVVRQEHGQEIADQAVERKATKAALERALKGKRGAVRAVLDEVRKQGGATRSQGTKIGEFELAAQLPEGKDDEDQGG